MTVELREITKDNLREVLRVEVAADQQHLVAPTSVSIAEAYFEPRAWFRAIYAVDVPVGFVMLYIDEDKPLHYLWRFLIGADHQRSGYGAAALGRVIDHVRGLPGATEIKVSWVPGPGSPEPFYRKYGFEPTGEMDGIEVVATLAL